MSVTHCDVHGMPWKWVPAGVSKKAPYAPYDAFQACQIKGCDQRPPRNGTPAAPTAPQAAPKPSQAPQGNPAGDARLRAASAAWSAAMQWAGAAGIEDNLKIEVRAQAGYMFILRAYQGQPVNGPAPARQPGEDDDLIGIGDGQTEFVR